MIPVANRFHGHNSLRYVYANGKAARSQQATVKWVRNAHRRNSRFSVVVSKKVIKGAVGRNRIRRRVYEYLRTRIDLMTDVYDVVVIVTSPELRTMPAEDLTSLLDQLFTKADLYKAS